MSETKGTIKTKKPYLCPILNVQRFKVSDIFTESIADGFGGLYDENDFFK